MSSMLSNENEDELIIHNNSAPITRRLPKCSYCGYQGHNVRKCNSPLRVKIEKQIANFTNVTSISPYVYKSRGWMHQAFENTIHNIYETEGNDQNVLILYYAILGIRNSSSAGIATNINYPITCIVEAIFNLRKKEIIKSGDKFLLEFETRQNDNALINRINEIISLYNKQCIEYLNITNLRQDINNAEGNELADLKIRLNVSICDLLAIRKDYTYAVKLFHDIYNEDPERKYINDNMYLLRQSAGMNDLTIDMKIKKVKIIKTRLTLKDKNSWTDIDCPICYDTIDKSFVYMTNCSHKFCFTCISQVINNNNNNNRPCPCCRSEINTILNKKCISM